MRQVYGETRRQRCWVHQTGNVLNDLPKGQQQQAKQHLHERWMAASRQEAEQAFDDFVSAYGAKYPKAVECLSKDRDVLLTFDDFPAEHWVPIRTTHPVESTFATVRLRTGKTRGCRSRETAFTMVFKLCLRAEKRWRRLNGAEQLTALMTGAKFQDGVRVEEDAA